MEKKKKTVALSSVFAGLFLTLLKLTVGILTGSIGILSEAAHSALDFAAAFITYLAVRISGKPADITHHYGHGKAESVSALIETGLLILTSVWIIYEAVNRLIVKSVDIQVTWYAFAVMGISIIVDISRSTVLRRVAKETKSQALEADALHFQSDIYSSAVVILGLVFVSFGIRSADAVAAILVAILVLFASYRLGKRTIDVLMDTAPEGSTEKITEITKRIEGVVNVDRLRVRPAGHSIFVDMEISISRKIPLEKVNEITKNIKKKIQENFTDADVIVHVNPIALKGETIIERIKTIAVNHDVSAHNVSFYTVKGKKFISFDLEVDEKLSLDKAHLKASHLEKAIQNELGSDVVINSHIEPIRHDEPKTSDINTKEIEKIHQVINKTKEKISAVAEFHDISIYNVDGKVQISLHCIFKNKISLEEAHNLTTKIESLVVESLPEINIERVSIHVEPKK